MTVVLAVTFIPAIQRLAANEQSRAIDFLVKFQENPAHPGLSLERVTDARDPDIWSARITRDLRAIVHKASDRYTLLYAGHHDDAYTWAERRRVEVHPVTGALQIIEAAEVVREELQWTSAKGTKLFADQRDDYLRSLGLPDDWLPVIREIKDDDQLLSVAGNLPEEVAERLIRLASGEMVTPPVPVAPAKTLTASGDSLRRFWVVEDASELAELLQKPIAAWVRFLHPSQRELVEGTFKGPAKVTGGAGTGKTVVAMHRARSLSRAGKRVLLTTFVGTLCQNLSRGLHLLCNADERSRITVSTIDSVAHGIVRKRSPGVQLADDATIEAKIGEFVIYAEGVADAAFLIAEWNSVVKPHGISSWSEYRSAKRTGRGRPLSAKDRRSIWNVYERLLEALSSTGHLPPHILATRAAAMVESGDAMSEFDAIIVDEVQDLTVAQLRLVRALSSRAPENLMLAGDGGQRIYSGGYSLRALGIDVRGRSKTLRLNYRTTKQIQVAADRILGTEADDLDGATESRQAKSLLRGPEPKLRGFLAEAKHDQFLVDEIRRVIGEGLSANEIAIFVRTKELVKAMQNLLHKADIEYEVLDRDTDLADASGVNIATMHRAKGLEFKVVFVARCNAELVPLASVIRKQNDPADRDAALALERQLLYVSLTRARDEAIVAWVGKPSPFLAPLVDNAGESA
ncbi:MAG: 3'-5' exonuclease [Thermoanaerobaculia bacterium]|jgi:superfamily I DNA/RNA helicase